MLTENRECFSGVLTHALRAREKDRAQDQARKQLMHLVRKASLGLITSYKALVFNCVPGDTFNNQSSRMAAHLLDDF
jgi:hypothetical protein